MALTDKSSIVVPKGFYGKANVLQGFNPQTENLVDLDVTRNTTATRVNEAGLIESVAANVPRRDFLNGGCGELLLEPQRTNLLTYSEQLDNAVWKKQSGGSGSDAAVNANVEVAPDGTNTADEINLNLNGGNTAPDFSIIQQTNFSLTDASGSIYLKGNTGTEVVTFIIDGFNTKQISLSTKWERYTIEGGDGSSFGIRLRGGDGDSDTATFYAWGAQLEEGSYPTSYIPTTASAVTRNQDVISATNIGSLLNDAEGGIYFEGSVFDFNERGYISLSDGTTQNAVEFRLDFLRARITVNNTLQADILNSAGNNNQVYKLGIKYKNNDFKLFVDGAVGGSDNTINVFPSGTLNTLDFSRGGTSSGFFHGRIRELIVFNNGPTDSELQTLTTP